MFISIEKFIIDTNVQDNNVVVFISRGDRGSDKGADTRPQYAARSSASGHICPYGLMVKRFSSKEEILGSIPNGGNFYLVIETK